MNFISNLFIEIILLIFLIVAIIYIWFQHRYTHWSKLGVPHLKPSFPFGNFNSRLLSENGNITHSIYKELRKMGLSYGGFYMVNVPFFMPLTSDLNKEVLAKNFQSFHDRGMYYNEKVEPLSAHIASLTGEKWRYVRYKLAPTFSNAKLKTMLPLIVHCCKNMLEKLEEDKKIDIHDFMNRFTSDNIRSCAFGLDGNSFENPNDEFRKQGLKLCHMNIKDTIRFTLAMQLPHILKKFRMCSINPSITNFFYNIVEKSIKYREENNVHRNDFMDSLIQLKHIEENNTNEGLTLNQIAAQVFFFYWAGFETNALTLTCCLYEIAKNHEIQEKLRQEVLNALQKTQGEITFETICKLSYMERVIQEVLRMYPPVVMLNRIVTEPFKLPNNSVLEIGTQVVLSTLGVHYDPEYYPDPYKFDPERFSEEEIAKRPPMTYFPFGDGPRICIGKKFGIITIKVALVSMLKNYKFSLHPDTKQVLKIISYANLLGLKDTVWLIPTKINN